MGQEKVTTMVLKVDLQCPCCYKKVKKTLCKFPQIRDQVYDEKGNKVIITVVCCSPEKIRDKLCCKGGKAIKSIDIKEPEKKKEPEKPKEPEKKKETEKPKEPAKPKEPEKPKVIVMEKPKEPEKAHKVVTFEQPKEPEKPKSNGKGGDAPSKPKEAPKPKAPEPSGPKPADKPKEAPKPSGPNPGPNQPPPELAKVVQAVPAFPAMPCYAPFYDSYGGTPCYNGYGVPPPPQPCYDGYYYGYGHGHDQYNRGYHVSRCDTYLSEENASGCSIM